MKATLTRKFYEDKQTLGEFRLEDNCNVIFECKTLELPWLDNKRRKSCIPNGTYQVKPRFSPKYKSHFHVKDVPNRSFILIHGGNYYTQILGCILVGDKHTDINGDGYRDVTNSRKTLAKLVKIAPSGFELVIE